TDRALQRVAAAFAGKSAPQSRQQESPQREVTVRTQVGIIGAGPAGLMLGQLLQQAGIDSVILEARSRDYVEQRLRAGLLEQGTIDLMEAAGVGARMRREGLLHEGAALRFAGETHRIDFQALAGKSVMIYAQQEVVKDLIAARLAAGAELLF